MPGPDGRSDGAEGLHDANVAWLNAAFDTAEAQQSWGVMIIWQDDPFDGNSDEELEDVLISSYQTTTATDGSSPSVVSSKYRPRTAFKKSPAK